MNPDTLNIKPEIDGIHLDEPENLITKARRVAGSIGNAALDRISKISGPNGWAYVAALGAVDTVLFETVHNPHITRPVGAVAVGALMAADYFDRRMNK